MPGWAILVALLPGCQLVFELEEPAPSAPASLRGTYAACSFGSTTLAIPRAPEIENGDVAIVVMRSSIMASELFKLPPDWNLLADPRQVSCSDPGGVQAWYSVGEVTAEAETFDFEVDAAVDLDAILTVYRRAHLPASLDQKNISTDNAASQSPIALGEAISAPGASIWIGGASTRPWIEVPALTTRRDAIQNLVVFELSIETEVVPALDIPITASTCANVLQLTIEPRP